MNEPLIHLCLFFLYASITAGYGIVFFRPAVPLRRVMRAMVLTAILFHTAALTVRALRTGHAPMSDMHESLMLFSFCLALIFLLADAAADLSRLGVFAFLLNLALLILAFSRDTAPRPLMPALQSSWLWYHVITCFLSYAAFALSFVAAAARLLPFHGRWISSVRLDGIIYRLILFGFPLLALGIMTGAVWAHQAWGAYWSWDPKETWALVTWLLYAVYLHLRVIKRWSGLALAWVACLAFACVGFTYFGVSFLLSGLHSYL